jgi:hypothetical protein
LARIKAGLNPGFNRSTHEQITLARHKFVEGRRSVLGIKLDLNVDVWKVAD